MKTVGYAHPYGSDNRWPRELTPKRVTFGERKAFHLLFDAVNNRIGLKLTAPEISNAYSLAKYGKHAERLLRAWRLMEEFGFDLPGTIQFDSADVDQDGVLVLDLRTAKVSTRSIAHTRKPR